jgi:hypothetical protein
MLRAAGIPKLTLGLLLLCCWPPAFSSGVMALGTIGAGAAIYRDYATNDVSES